MALFGEDRFWTLVSRALGAGCGIGRQAVPAPRRVESRRRHHTAVWVAPYVLLCHSSRASGTPDYRPRFWREVKDFFPDANPACPLTAVGRVLPTADVGFYGDSFVKPFLVVRAAMLVRVPVWLDQSIWKIGGRGMRKVRASARTSFYPCRTQASDTTCSIRAECAGKPLLPTRPIYEDGHVVVTRRRLGRVDLRS